MSDRARQPGFDRQRATAELAGLVQPVRLLGQLPGLLHEPRRRTGTVVVLPGRGFGDRSTAPLRSFLRSKGYRVRGWGRGANRSDARTLVGPVVDDLEAIVEADGAPVALVGQSLGGYLAREVARRRPDLVSQVVTIGSPLFRPTSTKPLLPRVTALWSEADQVVPPGWALDDDPAVRRVEVGSTHFAMGFDPDVWRAVVRALDEPT